MYQQIEIASLDLRYESCRMKSPGAERQLLTSIVAHGIRDPLRGVETAAGSRILLDGFKRYRCAKKLNMGIVAYHSLGSDEALAIIKILRISNAKGLSILEQARFIDELKSVHKMSVSQIAGLLTTDIDPRIVGVDYAWWFPEKGASGLYGWADANINILTDDNPPFNHEMGSSNLRGILCKVYT
jgi:hypothetical protein